MFYVCSVTCTPSTLARTPPDGPCPERRARNLALLDEMIELAAQAARDTARRIAVQADAVEALLEGDYTNRAEALAIPLPELNRSLERSFRSLRLFWALQMRMEQPAPARPIDPQTARANAQHREQAHAAVKRLIETESAECDRERLLGDYLELLEDTDVEDDVTVPLETLIVRLCGRIGLKPGWEDLNAVMGRGFVPEPMPMGSGP